MRRSLGIMSGAFALRSRRFALVGRLVFLLFGSHFVPTQVTVPLLCPPFAAAEPSPTLGKAVPPSFVSAGRLYRIGDLVNKHRASMILANGTWVA
jgi:hypothetical protein